MPISSAPSVNHWQTHARTWEHFGSPLRPCHEDVHWMEGVLSGLSPQRHQSLLMGVTPELTHMAWPDGTTLLAVDQNPDMIRHQWLPAPPVNGHALCGDWEHIALPDQALDVIVGDGVLVFFSFPEDVHRLMEEMHRLLHDDGRWLLRVFVRPEQPESVQAVYAALSAGQIGSFHAYKWRLAMALQPSLAQGVRPADVWLTHHRYAPPADILAARTGWSLDTIGTLQAYREATSTYYFPTLSELRQTLAAHFEVLHLHLPRYELGDRCPLLALRPLPR